MLETGELKKGKKIEIDGAPYVVTQFEFVKPGKGQALYKCKLKNMITGAQFDKTYRSGEKLKKASLDEREMEYLYFDGEAYCFMDNSNYEQEFLIADQIGDNISLLKENITCSVLFFDERPIGVTLPNFVVLRVTQSGMAGISASSNSCNHSAVVRVLSNSASSAYISAIFSVRVVMLAKRGSLSISPSRPNALKNDRQCLSV